jgi:hypothetical protein
MKAGSNVLQLPDARAVAKATQGATDDIKNFSDYWG